MSQRLQLIEDLYLNSIPKGKYLPIWQQYVPAIMKALEAGGCHETMVSKELFESVGKRKATGYNFRKHNMPGGIHGYTSYDIYIASITDNPGSIYIAGIVVGIMDSGG